MDCSEYQLITIAHTIAIIAHKGQYRRGPDALPYITHPEAVALALIAEGENADVIAVAWLHDVLEDTSITFRDLLDCGIPHYLVAAVQTLTKYDSLQPYEDYIRLVCANKIARKVKIADIKHNLSCNPTDKQIKKYTKALQILQQY